MRILACRFLILASAAALQGRDLPEDPLQPPPLLSQGTLNTGFATTENSAQGQFSVLLPLLSTVGEAGALAGTLVYAEPFASWMERGAGDAGLGLGVRHLFGGQPASALSDAPGHIAGFLEEGWYVGANLYGSVLQTSNDARYWQMTPGVELGTRYLELRAHYQIPFTSETTHTSSTTNLRRSIDYTSTSSSSYSYPTYVFNPNRPLFPDPSTYTHTSTHSTQTSARVFSRVRNSADIRHESLQGWDAETAALVPWLDQYMDLKLVGGYASFHSTSLEPLKYDSWQTGVELRPFPACVLSAVHYSNEHLAGAHWLYGIRLELPFETANIGDGMGGFWGHIKAAFKPRRRHLSERLVESAHAQQLQPQTASYATKASLEVHTQIRGVITYHDHWTDTAIDPVNPANGWTYSFNYDSQSTIHADSQLKATQRLRAGFSPEHTVRTVSSSGLAMVSSSPQSITGTTALDSGLGVDVITPIIMTSSGKMFSGSGITVGPDPLILDLSLFSNTGFIFFTVIGPPPIIVP